MKSWKLIFQPGEDERKEVGIKTHLKFGEDDSGDMAISLKLPDNNYEVKGSYYPLLMLSLLATANIPL